MTLISTACSWVNMFGGHKAAIFTQVGQFYFGRWVSFSSAVTPAMASNNGIAGHRGQPAMGQQQPGNTPWIHAQRLGHAGSINDILAAMTITSCTVTNRGARTERWVVRMTNSTSVRVHR